MEFNAAETASSGLNTPPRDWAYGIISKVAYLIGVPVFFFKHKHWSPQIEVFHQLEENKYARIVRHLCIIRTAILRNFHDINEKMEIEHISLTSLPEFVPQKSIDQLTDDGIFFIKKSSKWLGDHVIEINRILSDRINNCRRLFPPWVNWLYIRELFLMPNGLTIAGEHEAAQVYYNSLNSYPYKMYINWRPCSEGNILYNDQKFLSLLYQWHNDEFTGYGRLSGENQARDTICDYIMAGEKTVILVDCGHSNPCKLSAAFKRLDAACRQKISSVILFEDDHSAETWSMVEQIANVPVEHNRNEYVEQNKTLAAAVRVLSCACQEYYENHADSFILVSNDSEYWKLTSSLANVRSMVLVEREKCSPEERKELLRSGISCCYMDDSEEVKFIALFQALYQYLGKSVQFNAHEMLNTALQVSQVDLTEEERQNFFTKYIKTMQITMNGNGDVSIEFKDI